jgi:hypothetical protein
MDHDEMTMPDGDKSLEELRASDDHFQHDSENAPHEDIPAFAELTLADVMGRFVRSPLETWRNIAQIARQPANGDTNEIEGGHGDLTRRKSRSKPIGLPAAERHFSLSRVMQSTTLRTADEEAHFQETKSGRRTVNLAIPSDRVDQYVRVHEALQLVLRLAAFLAAVWGGLIIARAERQGLSDTLVVAAPFWIIGFMLWLASEFVNFAPVLRQDRAQHLEPVKPSALADLSSMSMLALVSRMILAAICLILCIMTWRWTEGNLVTLPGFITWIVSMVVAVWVFAPRGWNPIGALIDGIFSLRKAPFQWNWTMVALIAIMIMGAVFRFTDIAGTPPEMTSDHVEKILDSLRVAEGDSSVFFFRNGGREPIQMYLMALLSKLPGFDMNFYTLKFLTAIEGFITIPVMFWLGRAIIGREDRRLGNLTGLATAALVATSHWHQTLSHLGLRIVLTSLVAALLLIYLARGFRTNQRMPFIIGGLVLGIGLYTYQAVRMLPVVIVVGFAIVFLYRIRRPREVGRLFMNGVALVAVAVVAFVPLWGYINEFPDAFLQRTNTRLFGDSIITEVDAQGNRAEREAGTLELLWNSREALLVNLRDAALSYNFKGDIAWLQNAPYYPFMDAVAGALLIGGLAAWLGLMMRRRDPMFDLWLPMCAIMLLPSALAIAYPIENPSATRLSGSLPGVYLLAGFALALLTRQITRVVGGRMGYIVGGAAAVVLVITSLSANWQTYFRDYRASYSQSVYAAYSDPGKVLRGFVDSGGGYGNAFMIVFPYWWDHRIVGIEGGAPNWPGDIVDMSSDNHRDRIQEALYSAWLREGEFHFDPNRDILFFYEPTDDLTQERLQELFPGGYWQLRETYLLDKTYKIFRVPAIGEDGWAQFMADHNLG